MEILNLAEKIRMNFDGDVSAINATSLKRLVVTIRKEALLEIANYFIEELQFRFIIATAMLSIKGFEVLYHFSDDRKGDIINLQVELGTKEPAVDSLANMIHAANWIEREMHDLFGIVFLNHPDARQFFADENWPENIHPYAEPNKKKAELP